jgi:hypothetical protein
MDWGGGGAIGGVEKLESSKIFPIFENRQFVDSLFQLII